MIYLCNHKCTEFYLLPFFIIFQVDLVKFSPSPIEQSLLRLESTELNDLAIECFVSVMRYMGDLPMTPDVTEVKCVYTILMVSAFSSSVILTIL